MFAIEIPIASKVVFALKLELNRALPHIKSSHRCEALARALGYGKYASLLSVMRDDRQRPVRALDTEAFTTYLAAHRFVATEQPLLEAAALALLAQVGEDHAVLGIWGFGPGPWVRGNNGVDETTPERRARFNAERKALCSKESVRPFMTTMAMLANVPKTRTVRPKAWSYWLKHIAESLPSQYPDGRDLGPVYVPNGVFIAAAITSGFEYRLRYDHNGFLDRNGTFNMPYKVLEDLDVKARPNGARAEARQRRYEERLLTNRRSSPLAG